MPDPCNGAPDRERRLDEALAAYLEASEGGQSPDPERWLERYPDLSPELNDFLSRQDRFRRITAPLRAMEQSGSGHSLRARVWKLVAPPDSLPLPRRFGDYELLAELGQGGMGVVYKARQISLNRLVALKMIRAGRLATPADVQRFRHEAETAAQLDHPHIVSIHDTGVCEGHTFFTMKLVEGGSLALVRRPGDAATKQDQREAARLVAKVARAVHYAHQRGILHRDLKPSNILLDSAGEPHVSDFGLAKWVQADKALTMTGAIIGTPAYMAPEQASAARGRFFAGSDGSGVTTSADVYGLGAVLYFLLAGRPPFQGATILDTLQQVKDREPTPPTGRTGPRNRDLDTICLKCLDKDPSRRYGSAEALADDLEAWLQGYPIRAKPTTLLQWFVNWARRRPAAAALVVAAVLIPGLAFGVIRKWQEAIEAGEVARNAQTAVESALQKIQAQQKTVEEERIATAEARKQANKQWLAAQDRRIAQALQLHAAGDLFGSLPWFAKALMEERDADRKEQYRSYLQGVLRNCPRLVQLWEHKASACSAEFSRDGRLVLTASSDRTARVWDAESGRAVTPPLAHQDEIHRATFDPTATRVLTASKDGTAKIWDARSGKLLCPPLTHDRDVLFATFSRDGRRVVTRSTDGTARVWDAESGRPVGLPLKHYRQFQSADFSPDGRRILTVDWNEGKARMWETETGRALGEPLKTTEEQGWAVFNSNGRRILTRNGRGNATVWDGDTGRAVSRAFGVGDALHGATFSPDGRWVATLHDDGISRVWESESGRPIGPAWRVGGLAARIAFSPDGNRIVTGTDSGLV